MMNSCDPNAGSKLNHMQLLEHWKLAIMLCRRSSEVLQSPGHSC